MISSTTRRASPEAALLLRQLVALLRCLETCAAADLLVPQQAPGSGALSLAAGGSGATGAIGTGGSVCGGPGQAWLHVEAAGTLLDALLPTLQDMGKRATWGLPPGPPPQQQQVPGAPEGAAAGASRSGGQQKDAAR